MGCYLMTSATFSDLVPIACFGTPGWMDYVENSRRRGFDGMDEAATGLIDKSPWEIPGLPKRPTGGKGVHFGMLTGPGSSGKDLGANLRDLFS